jgi:hypothetical protein
MAFTWKKQRKAWKLGFDGDVLCIKYVKKNNNKPITPNLIKEGRYTHMYRKVQS